MSKRTIKAAWAALSLLFGAAIAGPSTASAAAPPAVPPAAFFQLAELRFSAKDFAGAERILRDAITVHPAQEGFHYALGEVLAARGESAEAFYEFQWELLRTGADRPAGTLAAKRAADLCLSHATAEISEVFAAMQGMGTDPASTKARLSAVKATRGSRFVLDLYVAEAAAQAGDRRGAEAIYRSLLERDPAFVPGYVELAALMESSGKPAEARALTAKAKQIDGSHWSLGVSGRKP